MPRLLVVHHTASPATGLKWRRARPPVSVIGAPDRAGMEACWELGATLAAELAGDAG